MAATQPGAPEACLPYLYKKVNCALKAKEDAWNKVLESEFR
jgi:hypothetical protein